MIAKETLRRIALQQKDELSAADRTVKREILDEVLKWMDDRRIIILTGIRRCGKSTLLRQMMQKTANWCYVNFEHEAFLDFRAQDFEQLNEVLTEVYGSPKVYFFDEIQNIDSFEAFVRRLQDQGKKVVITGSNASLLSKEFGTRLTGRYMPFEVYPFSFNEYLQFKGIAPEKSWLYKIEKKVLLIKSFGEYLINGGMPEYLKNRDKNYIKTVYDNILYKDIIARYSIKRQKVLKEIVNILMANISALVTYNSLRKDTGLSNAITVKEYISYLADSYLFFEMQKFDFSVRRQLGSPKKVYVIDPVFNQVLGFNFSENKGKLLENAVFIDLKRKGEELYYPSNKNECDFLLKEGARISRAVQVCYELNKENREREIAGLLEAMDKFKLKQGIILTHDQEDEIREGRKTVKVIPVWKWMLGNVLR